jgi:Tfp pilus assembly protein PilN
MYVALNISSSNIKVLSLKGTQVKKWANLDLTGGLVHDGQILQPQALGETINSLFKSNNLPRDRVIASIAGLSFTYRFINLPRLKPALVEESILRAAKKEISLPLDELYLSWQPLPGKGKEQSYFILGVPRNLIDSSVQTLKIAGIPPYLMDLRPLALARTARRNDAIVVNLEPDCFDIVFITGGLPTVIHSITPRSEGATLEDNIRRLADELTKTAAFYQSNHPDVQLSPTTPLLLTGDLATETAASELLQAEIEYPIEPLYPPVQYPDSLPVAAYTASIGLALKRTPLKSLPGDEQTHFLDIDVNILAGKFRKPKAKPVSASKIWLGVLLAICVVLLYPLYQARQHVKTDNLNLETNLSNIQRELNLATLVDEETVKTQDSIKVINNATDAIKSAVLTVLGTRGDFGNGLRLVTGVMPSQTTFTSIEVRSGDITVRGEADSVFSVVEYATALENENKFVEVRITALDESISSVSGTGQTGVPSEVKVITFEILILKQPPAASAK